MIAIPAHAPEREQHAIGLAIHTARRWFGKGSVVDDDDIVGAALLGAAKALQRFDPARGVEFQTYAIALIRAEILEELRRGDHLSRNGRRAARVEEATTGSLPTWAAPPLSLDYLYAARSDEESEFSLADLLPDEDADPEVLALVNLLREEWLRVVDWLTERQRDAILGHYYQDRRLSDLAREEGCKENTISARHRAALASLRYWAKEGALGVP